MRCLLLVALVGCGGGTAPRAAPPPVARAAAKDAAPAPAPSMSTGDTWLCGWDRWEDCRERCDAGNALSCARLAIQLDAGRSRWSASYDCELGDVDACLEAAVIAGDD